MPKRLLISETGVSVSAYSRVTSRSCASLSLRRVVVAPSPCAPRVDSPSEPESLRESLLSIHLSYVSSTCNLQYAPICWHMYGGDASDSGQIRQTKPAGGASTGRMMTPASSVY